MRFAFSLSARLATAVVLGVACDPPGVSMTLGVPADATPAWFEIGALPNGCPAPSEIAGGLPPSGVAARVAYGADAAPLPLGNLATGRYGFAAIARRDDCGVIAAGCTTSDVAKSRAIDVTLDSTSDPDASACTNGLVCSNARCVPPTGGDDPNAGAGCSMVLVGAGPLPDALDGGPFVTAPAIVATAAGTFIIAYAEYLDGDGTERLTIQPIDVGGGALAPDQRVLDGHCPGQTSIDAAALVMSVAGGLAALSRPPCTGQSGFEFFPLDPTGAVTKRNVFLNATAPTISLSTHALTSAATPGRFLLASNVSAAASLFSTEGIKAYAQTTTAFGTPQDTSARVVRTANALSVEVDGPSTGDAGIAGSVARIYVTTATTDPIALGSPVDQVAAAVSALTMLDGRAFLITNGAGKGEDVAFRAYDVGKSPAAATGGFSALKSTAIVALDAATAQNRLFCALEQQDSVAIAVIDGASSTSPQILRRVDLASDIRIPKSAHDGPIAIAATDSRIAITWVAHKTSLVDGDPVGGYAVFACLP